MQVNLTGHHVDITDALRAYVDEKIARLERHFDHVTNVRMSSSALKSSKKARLRFTWPERTYSPMRSIRICTPPSTRWSTNSTAR